MPCALVGNLRDATKPSDDGVPLCTPHHEFYRLAQSDRDGLIRLWADMSSATSVREMFRLYRTGHASSEAQPVLVLGGAA